MFVLLIISLIFSGAVLLTVYIRNKYQYWHRKKVPCISPTFPFGNTQNPWTSKDGFVFVVKKHYDFFKLQGNKHGGLYSLIKPFYLPIDLDYLKNIMTKDFQYFSDHGIYYNEKNDPLSAHLFNLNGRKWKNLRTKLTSAFTTGKIKTMIPMFLKCSEQLIEAVSEYCSESKPIDIKDVLSCYTTDIIGSCAFGLNCNSFKNPDGDFRQCGKNIFLPAKGIEAIKVSIAVLNHKLGRKLGIVTTPKPKRFLWEVVKNVVEYREQSGFVRNDFLQILIDLKNYQNQLTMHEIAAQAYVFFAAGFETSSTTMTFCLYELARNIDIQENLRREIQDNLQEMTYESIMCLKYLNQVVEETLRKYPPAGVIPRKCVQNYTIPDTDIIIEKGTSLVIPILAIHHDPDYFPDPDHFDPERFNEENRNKIIPFTYMPFGEGPRICIGARFGMMQIKVGLVALIQNFEFSINQKTSNPLVMNPFSYILTAQDGVWLDVRKI